MENNIKFSIFVNEEKESRMIIFGEHCYSVYILTNFNKTVLYIGVTKDLLLRREQYEAEAKSAGRSFTARYKCFYIVYYEDFPWIQDAIQREKQLKHWPRKRKEELITAFNPEWKFLTDKDIGL